MKKIQLNIKSLVAFGVVFFSSCTYDFPEADPNTVPTAGTADFTRIISVGNSLTAGFMNNALYTEGQNNSYASIIAHQALSVGGGDFNQPDVGSDNGCSNPGGGCTQGRLYLKISGSSAAPTPTAGDGGTALAAYTGDKSALSNFGVPGVTLLTAQIPQTGGPAGPAPYNPYYARIASEPGTSTLIGDAAGALENGGTFFTFWLGNNDVLGYATGGGSNPTLLTSSGNFDTRFNAALDAMLTANTDAKGAVANIPNVTSIPFFKTIPYKPIPLDAPTAAYLQTNLANNYNAFVDAMVGVANGGAFTQAEADSRKLTYAAGANAILINDETLTDLGPYMAGPYAGLLKYRIARQTKVTDLVCLTASPYIGKSVDLAAPGDSVLGVSFPLYNTTNAAKGDDLILIPTEISEIQTAVTDFNEIIEAAVVDNSDRLVLVDANAALLSLPQTVNGIKLDGTFIPPYGAFSVDGVHPNARGSAFIANVFITAINAKFEARIPLCNPNDYAGNALPIP